MAKKGTPGLRQALKVINQLGRQMNREAMGDYGVALSASKAGQAGLRKQLGRLEGDAMRTILGQQRGLNRLTDAARAQQRRVRTGQANTVNRYGAALAGSVSNSFSQARATAAAGTKVQKGYAGAGRTMSKTGQTVAGIASAGAKAQGAAAKYALAQALQARNTVDAQTLAQMTADIYKTQLQFEQQKAMMDYQYELEQKKLKDAEEQGFEQLGVVVKSAGDYAMGLRTLFNEEPEASPAEQATVYAASQGIEKGTEEYQLILTLSQKMFNAGAGPVREGSIDWMGDEGANLVNRAVTDTFTRLYPQFDPVLPTVESYMATWSQWVAVNSAGGGAPAVQATPQNPGGITQEQAYGV